MNLPNLFKNQPESKQGKSYLALFLSDQIVQAALWKLDQEVAVIEKSKVHYFTQPGQEIVMIDESLQELGPKSESVDDVIFGLEPGWVSRSGILDKRREFLKEVAKALVLKAVGFVVITEALADYLIEKKPLVSSVLVYIGHEFIYLLLIKQGKLKTQISVGRSGDLIVDLKEALARLNQNSASNEADTLPPNLFMASSVLSDSELKDQQQYLLNKEWHKQYNFIQKPVISLLNQEKLVDLVSKQGGKALAEAEGLKLRSQQSQEQQIRSRPTQRPAPKPTAQEASSFGVPIAKQALSSNQSNLALPEKDDSEDVKVKKRPIDKRSLTKKIIVFGVIFGLIASLVLGWLYLKLNYKIILNVDLAEVTVSRDVVISLDAEVDRTDPEELILKVDSVSKSVEDTIERGTTGVKLVGEEAKGKVTIFNKTSQEKTFEEGVKLVSGGLEFCLTKEVTVPAAEIEENDSGDGEVKKYGQVDAEVKASEIGADGNLDKGAEFKIADFSEDTYSAKSVEDFSNGSSREIRVASEQDQAQLKADLTKSLLKKLRQEYKDASGNGEYYVPTDDYEIVEESYSAEIGDEAETVSLTLNLDLAGMSYDSENLRPLAQKLLEKEIPKDFQLLEDSADFLSQPVSKDEDTGALKLEADLSARAQATIDDNNLKSEIVGADIKEAEAKLTSSDLVDEVGVQFLPSLAQYIFKNLPDKSDRIIIKTY